MRRTFFKQDFLDFYHLCLCILQKVAVLLGICTAVSMDTGCWFEPLGWLSPSKLRVGWGRGWVVWILGGDAEWRDRKNKGERLFQMWRTVKGYFKFPPRFLWFLLEVEVTALTACPSSVSLLWSLHPKVLFFLGPVPALKVCFHISSGNSPHPAHCPKPSGQICGTKSCSSWKSKTVHNNVFPH